MADLIDSKKGTVPAWWNSAAGLALAGTIVTATYSFGTAVVQKSSDERVKSREVLQNQMKIDTDLETTYFRLAIDSASPLEQRMQVLRYLKRAAYVSPEMQVWAQQEYDALGEQQRGAAQVKLNEAEDQLKQAQQHDASSPPAEAGSEHPTAARERTQRELEVKHLRARVEQLAQQAQQQTASEQKARACNPDSIAAPLLGVDDPDQASANAYCASSARAQKFSDAPGAKITWTVRYQGRNFQCQCKLSS